MKRFAICLAFLLILMALEAQATANYSFTSTISSYEEISGGTALGNESTADQRFVDPLSPLGGTTTTGPGFPLEFPFYFNGYEFDRVALTADGWLSLGQSWLGTPVSVVSSSQYAPLSSTNGINPPLLVSRISALGVNLAAQTGANLRIETIGTAPNRVFVAQWHNYRKSGATGDSFNFQIRLEETSNQIIIKYGSMACNASSANVQVGFRAEPANTATYYRNRTTTSDWSATAEGTAANSTCTLNSTVFPASGTSFIWAPPTPINASYTVGTGGDFTTISAVINFLNTNQPLYGIPEGGTVFNILAGEVFSEDPPPPAITAIGGSLRPIVFQKSGAGNNPLIKVFGTTATNDAAFRLQGCDWLSFQDIAISNADASTALEHGFYLEPIAYNGCRHISINGCDVTLDRSNPNTRGIYSPALSTACNTDCTFSGNSISDTNQAIHLTGYSVSTNRVTNTVISENLLSDIAGYALYIQHCIDVEITSNEIYMCPSNTVEFRGISFAGTSSSMEFSGNIITGNSTGAVCYGIYLAAGSSTCYNNLIQNFIGTSVTTRYGIRIDDGSHDIYANTIRSISSNGHVYGIGTFSGVDLANLYGNKVYNLNTTNTGGYIAVGMLLSGTAINAANNMIYDLGALGYTVPSTPMIRGINTGDGTNINIYYNTIYLKGGSGSSGFSSACLYIDNDNPMIDLRNNIFVDRSTPGSLATARATAIWKSYPGFARYTATTDRNIYYAGIPDTQHLICYDDGASYSSLLDYKNAVGSCELGSLTENVPFVSTEVPIDVHIRTDVATYVESNALPITGWEYDFDEDLRHASTPDIGADEGNFMITALVPDPAQVISPLDNAIVVSPTATLNWSASVSGGVPTGYVLYFGTDNPPTNIVNGLDMGNTGSYDPNPDMQYLSTYYWKIVPYNATGYTEATLCPVWTFQTHALPLNGAYTIGSSGYYPSFTMAITHLNAAGVGAGGVTFQAAAGEVFAENSPLITCSGTAANPILFTSLGSGNNPKITPAGGDNSYGIRIEGGDYITFDHIDIANPAGSSTLEYGYWIRGISGAGPDNNTIQNCNITLSRNITSVGIFMDGASGSLTHNNISILNNTIDNATQAIYLDPQAEAYNTLIQGNTITNATTYGIYHNNGTDSQILSNSISFPETGTATLQGIYTLNLINATVASNTITGGYTSNAVRALSQNGGSVSWHHNSVYNLQSSNEMKGFNAIAGTCTLYNNNIHDLSSLTQAVQGMDLHIEYGGTATAYNNLIYDLSSTTTYSYSVIGIQSNGTDNVLYNNYIYDLRNPAASTVPQVIGIQVTNRTVDIMYNTIYLDAVGSGANFSSAAIHNTGGTSLQLTNNILCNLSTPGTTGKAVTIWNDEGFATIDATTDYNILYAGIPSSSHLISYTSATAYITLDEYKAAAVTHDQNSFTEATPFVSTTIPYDLHIVPGAATLAESHAIPLASISTDYDNDPRNASTPDIGADEGDFTLPLLPPSPALVVTPAQDAYAISLTPLFSWYASSSGGTPTGYRLSLGTDNPPTNLIAALDLGNVLSYQYSGTLDYLGTYYWSIEPYNSQGSASACPVWNFSTHQAPLTGTWTIGSSGYYPDFTHAINYLNASGVGIGGVVFMAAAGEVFTENPPVITATGTSDNPITFGSSDHLLANPIIKATGGENSYGIKIAGGDYITFDRIDITNAPGSTNLQYGYWLEAVTGNGCTDNTIQYCYVTLSNSTPESACIRSDSATGRNNHRNHYLCNTLDNSRYGIYLYDSNPIQGTLVQGNNITNMTDYGIYSRSCTSIIINTNTVYMAANNTRSFYGISVMGDNGDGEISTNTIIGATTSAEYRGIYVFNGNLRILGNLVHSANSSRYIYGIQTYYPNARDVYDNTVHSLICSTNNNTLYGIALSGSTAYNNTVYNLNAAGSLRAFSVHNGTAYANRIYGIGSSSSSGVLSGMYLSGTPTVYNNMICALDNPASSANPQVRGINVSSNANLYYNSVLLNCTATAATSSSAALYIETGTTIRLINNIFSNKSAHGASGMAVALWKEEGEFDNITSDSNRNIWYAGSPGTQNLICYYGTLACITLEDYKTANIGKDQGSFTENTPFISETTPYDLHLDPFIQTYAEGNALVLAGIGIDFDNEARHTTQPDIGADEGNFSAILAAPAIPAYLSPANGATGLALNTTLNWAAGSSGGMPDTYNVYFGTTNPPPLVAAAYTETSYTPLLYPNSTYYWKIDAVNTMGTATGPIWSFTSRNDYTIMELPFLESFEEGNTQGSTTINRWTQALGSSSNFWTANSTNSSFNRAPRSGSFNVTLSATGDTWLFRPMYLQQGNTYELELYARQYRTSGSMAFIQVKYGSAAEIGAMANNIISFHEFVDGDYQSAVGSFTAPSTGIWYLGINGICSTPTNYLSLDDITLREYVPSPVFSIDPPSWNYGMVSYGTSSDPKAFVITNAGDADLIINSGDIYLSGSDTMHFTLTDPGANLVIPPLGTATLNVSFSPQNLGIKNALLNIIDNVSGRNLNQIPLSGRGIGPLEPPFVMDFEEGWLDWITVNDGQINKWQLGTAAPYRNSYSAYISQDNGSTNTYNLSTSSYVHFYHDVIFPADMNGLRLKFNWKGMGEPGFDYLSVHITDTSFVPVAGEHFSTGQIGMEYSGASLWQVVSINLDNALAGQTKRLIFSWHNDGGGGSQAPASIDNIRIVPQGAALAIPQNVSAYSSGSSAYLSWDLVPDANDYLIEHSDMFDGTFEPVGCAGNGLFSTPGSYLRRFFRIRATD